MTPLSNSILSASATPGAPSPATSGSREQLAKAAKDFEAIFVRQMLSSARKASAGLTAKDLAVVKRLLTRMYENLAKRR